MRGKGMWLLHFLGIFTYIFVFYTGKENVLNSKYQLYIMFWMEYKTVFDLNTYIACPNFQAQKKKKYADII